VIANPEPEEPLFEDRILPVPEGQAEAEALHVVGNACDAVLAPAIGARAGVIVGEEIPGVTVLAVILADGSPLSFAEVRPPLLPCGDPGAGVLESVVFAGYHKSSFRDLHSQMSYGRRSADLGSLAFSAQTPSGGTPYALARSLMPVRSTTHSLDASGP
jgi:hypothetical protein